MKTSTFLSYSILAILFVSIFSQSCKKNDTTGSTGTNNPIVTDIGSPTGDAATTTIGADGGTVSSLDGYLTVTIPAGALPAATTISIQPIINTAPSGVGDGYRLLPEGTTFSKPVQLTYHYDTTLLNGNSPYLLWFLTQANDGSWDAMLDSEVDTALNTVTVESTHFSNWVIGNCLEIDLNPQNTHVKLKESVVFRISSFALPQTNTSNHTKLIANSGSEGTDILTPNDIKIVNWNSLSWKYNSKDAPYIDERGSLIPSGKTATYKAPSEMPENNIAVVTIPIEVFIKKQNATLNNSVYSKITIGAYPLKIKIDGFTVVTFSSGSAGFSKYLGISALDSSQMNFCEFQFYNVTAGAHRLATVCSDGKDLLLFWPQFITEQTKYFGLEYDIRKQTTDGCSLVHECGSGVLILDPYTKKVGTYISGTIKADVYYDDFSHVDCNTSTPARHTLEAEFYLPIQVIQ